MKVHVLEVYTLYQEENGVYAKRMTKYKICGSKQIARRWALTWVADYRKRMGGCPAVVDHDTVLHLGTQRYGFRFEIQEQIVDQSN